jgi:hypothetical protein
MPDLDDVNNNLLSVVLYKKLQKQLEPIVEKIDALEHATNIIEAKEGPRGATGNRGEAGIQGERGATGARGLQGECGETGARGIQGTQGIQGIQGERGLDGATGAQGIQGETGAQGERGEQGLDGTPGAQGERGLDGATGAKGIQGERGEKGDIGIQGAQGIQGIQGERGLDGATGAQGIQGERGLDGTPGAQGERGLDGATGAQGIQGETGAQGERGLDGASGKDAIIPDFDSIIEPFIIKTQTHIDGYIDKSEKTFKSWQSVVNSQLSSVGGGGEVWLRHLNDVDRTSTRVDGAFLKYNASTKKWVGVTNSITLTGDVTGSGIGSFATTIATGAVSLAKMANVASSTVFYRKTGGAGAPEVQSLSTLKTDLGLSGTNTGDQDLSGLVPYSGATGAVNLGSQSLTAGTITSNGNTVATVVDPVRTTLTGDGVLSTFAISGASGLVNPSALIVAIDGAMQEPTVDYTVGSGQITFTSPLANGSKAVVISPTNSLQISQMIPADGSVSSAKLANDLEVAGELTVSGQPALSSITNNHLMTYGLSNEIYAWADLPSGFANFSSTGGSVSTSVIGVSIDTGASTASFSTARARFAGFFNRSPLAWAGGIARNIPFASRRTRIRAIIDVVSLTGNAYFWFGVWEKNSLISTTDELDAKGFGAKITTTQLIAQTHNGTTLFQSSPSSLVLANTVLLEIDYYQQNLAVKVNGVLIATINGGQNVDASAQIHFYSYAPAGGVAGDQARVELKQMQYRITEN